MSLFTRLARNSLWLFVARVGAQGSMVLVTYLLARRLGVTGFGAYAFIATVLVIGNTLTTFGSDMVLIREIAAESDFSALPSALLLQLALSIPFIAGVFLLAPYLPNQTSESILALRVYSLALIPLAFYTVFTSMLRGRQRMDSYAWLNLFIAVLQVAVISLFVQHGTSIVILAYCLLVVQTAGAMAGGFLCAINFPGFWENWRFSWAETTRLFIACLPVAIIAGLGIVYQKLSLTMLSLLGSTSMVGWFSAAARVVEVARMGHFAAFTALYPAMANADGNKDSSVTFKRSWMLLLVASGAAALLVFFLANPIVTIFFGLEYQLSVPVLRILSFTFLPYTVNTYLTLVFLVEKRERILIRIFLVSSIILLSSNLWLIPRISEVGAAWSFFLAEAAQSCLLLLTWKTNFLVVQNLKPDKGVPYELSNLP